MGEGHVFLFLSFVDLEFDNRRRVHWATVCRCCENVRGALVAGCAPILTFCSRATCSRSFGLLDHLQVVKQVASITGSSSQTRLCLVGDRDQASHVRGHAGGHACGYGGGLIPCQWFSIRWNPGNKKSLGVVAHRLPLASRVASPAQR